jgi:hypothetical protein
MSPVGALGTQIHTTKPSKVTGLVKGNQDRGRSVLVLRSASHETPQAEVVGRQRRKIIGLLRVQKLRESQ